MKFIQIQEFIVFIVILMFSCKSIPEKPEGMKVEYYQKYTRELKAGKIEKNYYKTGLAMANLGESPNKVFKILKKAIVEDSYACEQLTNFNRLYREHGFKMILIKIDSNEFKKLCETCLVMYGESLFLERYKNDSINNMTRRITIDSSQLNNSLMDQLKIILEDDQKFRDLRKPRSMDQATLDSINLLKVEAILNKFGYPNVHQVSYEYNDVIWLVLQHQKNSEVRDKYYPILEEANKNGNLSDGLLHAYKMRSVHHGTKYKFKL